MLNKKYLGPKVVSLTHVAPEDLLSKGIVGGHDGVHGGLNQVLSGEYSLTLDAEQICIYSSML